MYGLDQHYIVDNIRINAYTQDQRLFNFAEEIGYFKIEPPCDLVGKFIKLRNLEMAEYVLNIIPDPNQLLNQIVRNIRTY